MARKLQPQGLYGVNYIILSHYYTALLAMAMSGKLQHQGGTCRISSILYSLCHCYLDIAGRIKPQDGSGGTSPICIQ